MAMSLAMLVAELSHYAMELGWPTPVSGLTAFGFTQNEATIRKALEKVMNQIRQGSAATEIAGLAHLAYEQLPGGQQGLKVVSEQDLAESEAAPA